MVTELKTSKELREEFDKKLNDAENLLLGESPDYQQAAKLANEVLAKSANNMKALIILANAMTFSDNIATALKICDYIKKLYPDLNIGYKYAAEAYLKIDDKKNFHEQLKGAFERGQRDFNTTRDIYLLCQMSGKKDEGLEYIDRAYKENQDNFNFLSMYCGALYENDILRFHEIFKKLYQLDPSTINKFSLDTFISSTYENQEQIDIKRARLMEKLDNLIDKGFKIDDLSKHFYHSIFFLAYHGRNNVFLRRKFSDFFIQANPDLTFTAEHCKKDKANSAKANPAVEKRKIKVGFLGISRYLMDRHPVGKCYNSLFTSLSEKYDEIEVHCITLGKKEGIRENDDELNYNLINKVDKAHKFNDNYYDVRRNVADLELDILIYTDIGMHFLTYYLAFARLAPVQCVLTGHPDTTGIPNMDYYLSSKDFESPDGQQYYSERLIKFNEIATCNPQPKLTENMNDYFTRKDLNLPEDKIIYYCPMKNQKIHPDFDWAVREILDRDKNAMIMFPKDSGTIADKVKDRIKKYLGKKYYDRVYFHPWANNNGFLSLLNRSDVVIDTFHFGSGTTAYYIFSADAPAITLPGATTGGRVLNAIYKRMGITDLIASDKEQFVELAIKVANDKNFNKEVRSKIAERKSMIFDNNSVVEEIAEFIKNSAKDSDYYKKHTELLS